jgi:ABC-type Fe3+ transport system substrate-binding protein
MTAFQQHFPKVQLNISVQLSKYGQSRIDRSIIDNEPYVDFAMLETVNDFPTWKRKGLLLPYKPSYIDDVNPAIKDISGASFPVGFRMSSLLGYVKSRQLLPTARS